jgi:hypothetical protein
MLCGTHRNGCPENHVDRFLNEHRRYPQWNIEYAGIAPKLRKDERAVLARNDIVRQDLEELTDGLILPESLRIEPETATT